MKNLYQTQILIIGGGITGTGLARDLALRGIPCILTEQGDINAGASGSNHGLLHSGARYVGSDSETASECREEAELLKKLAPQCIENTGGFFVAVPEDDENYIADFPHFCQKAGIPATETDIREAREAEPFISDRAVSVYRVEDASVDPFKLSLQNICHAHQFGARLLRHHEVIRMTRKGRRIEKVHLINTETGEEVVIEAGQIVNATGAWCGIVAELAGGRIKMVYSKGSLLVTHNRITDRVINRLRPPADGDIIVPGGTVSILGTTSVRLDNLDDIRPTVREVNEIMEQSVAVLPILEKTRFIRAYAGVRPLVDQEAADDDRSVSRGLILFDHLEDGLDNFISVPGGKLTTYRVTAEKAADMICERLGNTTACVTRSEPLPPLQVCGWSEPGLAPRVWMRSHEPDDLLLCECEMVPMSVIETVADTIYEQGGRANLQSIALRTRTGKGACQGSFCSSRVTAFLYDRYEWIEQQGLADMKSFLQERWKGERPVCWNGQLIQAALKEAIYCGLLGLELE